MHDIYYGTKLLTEQIILGSFFRGIHHGSFNPSTYALITRSKIHNTFIIFTSYKTLILYTGPLAVKLYEENNKLLLKF